MSRYVAAIVYRKRVGSMARKAILAYCAERANDDGTGIWASKLTISKEVECSKQTVIDTFKAFVEEGILLEVGKRKCSNGYVVEYDIVLAAVDALPDAISNEELRGPILDRSNGLTPRGQAAGPQEVKPVDPNRPKTVLKPSNPQPPDGGVDLFGEISSSEADAAEARKAVADRFSEIWARWPKNRLGVKKTALAAFEALVAGKNETVGACVQVDTLAQSVLAYLDAESRRNGMKYVPECHRALRKVVFLEYLGRAGQGGPGGGIDPASLVWDELTVSQKDALSAGTIPRSFREGLKPDGQITPLGKAWAAKLGIKLEGN